jgi:signal transduction histidine kinase
MCWFWMTNQPMWSAKSSSSPRRPCPVTGVGLTTVQRIVRKHGGHIWASSKPGDVANFFSTLGEDAPPA